MLSSIYISHEVVELSDLAAIAHQPDWRAAAITRLQQHGIRVVNPIDWAVSVADSEHRLNLTGQVRRALDLIDQSDGVLANLHRSHYGTAMEIFYAHRRGKLVTVVGQSPFSPWVVTHSQARFVDLDRALHYIIEEGTNPDLLSWVLQFEAQLNERSEQFPPAGEPDYQFFGGELPVLVFAPHATNYFREGQFDELDAYTGALVAALNRTARCHGLSSNYCLAADPCVHPETPMVRALIDVSRAGQIGLVVILLGMSRRATHPFVIETQPDSDPTVADMAMRLKTRLQNLEPQILVRSADEDVRPLTTLASEHLGLPCIVLRVHRRYRLPRLQPEALMDLQQILSEFISETGTELLRSAS